MVRTKSRRVAVAIGATLTVASLTISPAFAASESFARTTSAPPITQKHTVRYNIVNCLGEEAIAMVSTEMLFTRTAGSNRELEYAKYKTEADGFDCTNHLVGLTTGVVKITPHFGSVDQVLWSRSLAWKAVIPMDGAASAMRGHYTQRGGGPYVQHVCTGVGLSDNWIWGVALDFCPVL